MLTSRPAPIRRRVLALGLTALAVPLLTATQIPSASAFGTVRTLGQHAEHENITRAALACRPDARSDGSCFEPRSLDQIAGRAGTFGAVGAPDSDESLTPAAHCDNADHLAAFGYPRTREQATRQLQACVTALRTRFEEGVGAAGGTVRADGTLAAAESDLAKDCTFTLGAPGRDKCEAIEGLGRALHGVQDFYSHSNWTDKPATDRPTGKDNPPGLNLPAPSPLLALADGRPFQPSAVPADLTTGCFSVLLGCSGRVQHGDLNKDKGVIDPATGATSAPATPRGKTAGNFDRAVHGAVTDTRRQWADFRTALIRSYGKERGERIACVLTHDTPQRDCAPAN
ncbi:CinY protein [Streptomyces sp. ISL-11]|uniref:CinY protein n=1 Tax=Streptomyces sp. ISL-11 TaxID=2819174 RepID=UPI001BE9FFDE|nr:CinY protein [Streptomyces sp. ISL-11]MBT2387264.1 CinY protein [Streptomyces sp. ISL-11]